MKSAQDSIDSSSPKLCVLISTIDDRIVDALILAESLSNGYSVSILQQSANKTHFSNAKKTKNAEVLFSNDYGVTKSRNTLIYRLQDEIALLCDDDGQILEGAGRRILDEFARFPNAAVITFEAIDDAGNSLKRYPLVQKWHGMKSAFRVSSCEIACRPSKLKKAGIKFDEQFGLGSRYPAGEEAIFITDCLKQNLEVRFSPIPVVVQSRIRTGNDWNVENLVARGALFKRVFGPMGLIPGLIFIIKKYPEIKKSHSLKIAVKSYLRGFRNYSPSEQY